MTSESWFPVATRKGTPFEILASRRIQPRSAAVPLTVSSPELNIKEGLATRTSRPISSVMAWLQCRSLKPKIIDSSELGLGSESSWLDRLSAAVSV